jgi:hypothetical protein
MQSPLTFRLGDIEHLMESVSPEPNSARRESRVA